MLRSDVITAKHEQSCVYETAMNLIPNDRQAISCLCDLIYDFLQYQYDMTKSNIDDQLDTAAILDCLGDHKDQLVIQAKAKQVSQSRATQFRGSSLFKPINPRPSAPPQDIADESVNHSIAQGFIATLRNKDSRIYSRVSDQQIMDVIFAVLQEKCGIDNENFVNVNSYFLFEILLHLTDAIKIKILKMSAQNNLPEITSLKNDSTPNTDNNGMEPPKIPCHIAQMPMMTTLMTI